MLIPYCWRYNILETRSQRTHTYTSELQKSSWKRVWEEWKGHRTCLACRKLSSDTTGRLYLWAHSTCDQDMYMVHPGGKKIARKGDTKFYHWLNNCHLVAAKRELVFLNNLASSRSTTSCFSSVLRTRWKTGLDGAGRVSMWARRKGMRVVIGGIWNKGEYVQNAEWKILKE